MIQEPPPEIPEELRRWEYQGDYACQNKFDFIVTIAWISEMVDYANEAWEKAGVPETE